MTIINTTFASKELETAYNNNEQDIVRMVNACYEFARRECVYKYAEVDVCGSCCYLACGNTLDNGDVIDVHRYQLSIVNDKIYIREA